MKQYMILVNVDEDVLANKTVEGELGWLKESGITAQSIVEINDKGYMIDLPSQRMLPEDNLVVEVGGDIDYPRVSVMRDLGQGDYEELVRVEKNADEGIRSVTYIDQDGLEESETHTVEIYFTDPMEVLLDTFRVEAHSLSAQRLRYDQQTEKVCYDSPDVYGDTEFLYISDRSDGFELMFKKQAEENILPDIAAFFKAMDYDVELFKKHAPEKFSTKENSSNGAV